MWFQYSVNGWLRLRYIFYIHKSRILKTEDPMLANGFYRNFTFKKQFGVAFAKMKFWSA